MSGPIVVLVPVPPEPSLLLMSATALMAAETVRRAVQAVENAEAQAAAQREEHAQERQAHAQRWHEADAQHLKRFKPNTKPSGSVGRGCVRWRPPLDAPCPWPCHPFQRTRPPRGCGLRRCAPCGRWPINWPM